jgi:membrane protein YqaA with SNARE-associated domain
MFIGTFLADAFSFPIPPQFYLLTAVVSGGSPVVPIIVVSLASILGGHTGYRLARPLATHPLVHRLRHRSQERVDGLFRRYGYWAVAVGAIAPVPFPVLCWAAGLYHVSFPLFSLFTLLRVPRILFFYFLFRFGWGG